MAARVCGYRAGAARATAPPRAARSGRDGSSTDASAAASPGRQRAVACSSPARPTLGHRKSKSALDRRRCPRSA
eukprot:4954087-Prymnesium_polylepis.2